MRPIKDINIGDQYSRNVSFESLIWSVNDIDKSEKLVKIQAYSGRTSNPIGYPLWKRNSDSIFNFRVFNGLTNKVEI